MSDKELIEALEVAKVNGDQARAYEIEQILSERCQHGA